MAFVEPIVHGGCAHHGLRFDFHALGRAPGAYFLCLILRIFMYIYSHFGSDDCGFLRGNLLLLDSPPIVLLLIPV
jgi:hypothetical protein